MKGDAKTRIREGLTALFKQINGNNNAFSAEVTAVDVNTRSCTCIGISDQVGVTYNDVWLMPEICDGILYVPTVGSTVIIENNANLQPYIVMWSEIDKILWVGGGSAIQIDSDGIKLNGDAFDGLVKVAKLTEKLNDIENLLNDLITKYNSHTHILTLTMGTGTAATTLAQETGTIAPITSQSDIENTKVKHGDTP